MKPFLHSKIHVTTDDGVEYRCDINGQVWDRLYGNS